MARHSVNIAIQECHAQDVKLGCLPQGFGVCEYTNKQDAQDAIEQLDDSTLQGM